MITPFRNLIGSCLLLLSPLAFSQSPTLSHTDFGTELGPLNPVDPAWAVVEDGGGVQVLLRDVEGSSIEAFQGRTRVHASLAAILAVMEDPAACTDWVHQCSEARFISGNFAESFHYGVNDFPWPTDDRDYVLHIRNHHDRERGLVHRVITADAGHVPATANIRVTDMQIHYFMTPISTDETEVVWTQHTDPAGLIPGWMINMLLVDIPHESLSRLEKTANRDRYREATLVTDNSGTIVGVKRP